MGQAGKVASSVPSGKAPTSKTASTGSAVEAVYFDGRVVGFAISPSRNSERDFRVGPWSYGEQTKQERPSDKHSNLYLVSPGQQHRSERWEQYDHNAVVNRVSIGDNPTKWDVYWAIVLDPGLASDFRNERELLAAAQSDFIPGDLFEFSDLPGRNFLRNFLRISSLPRLNRFRRKNGRMPRLIIVPAGFTVQALASETGAVKSGTPGRAEQERRAN